MKIGVLRETISGESRVAATPETVKKMIALSHSVSIEAGAGIQAVSYTHLTLPTTPYV